jgi:hypothetical protein
MASKHMRFRLLVDSVLAFLPGFRDDWHSGSNGVYLGGVGGAAYAHVSA